MVTTRLSLLYILCCAITWSLGWDLLTCLISFFNKNGLASRVYSDALDSSRSAHFLFLYQWTRKDLDFRMRGTINGQVIRDWLVLIARSFFQETCYSDYLGFLIFIRIELCNQPLSKYPYRNIYKSQKPYSRPWVWLGLGPSCWKMTVSAQKVFLLQSWLIMTVIFQLNQ